MSGTGLHMLEQLSNYFSHKTNMLLEVTLPRALADVACLSAFGGEPVLTSPPAEHVSSVQWHKLIVGGGTSLT